MDKKSVHWIGGIRHPRGRMLPGWPCCCSGDKAEKLSRMPDRLTRCPDGVTCRKCLYWMSRDERAYQLFENRPDRSDYKITKNTTTDTGVVLKSVRLAK